MFCCMSCLSPVGQGIACVWSVSLGWAWLACLVWWVTTCGLAGVVQGASVEVPWFPLLAHMVRPGVVGEPCLFACFVVRHIAWEPVLHERLIKRRVVVEIWSQKLEPCAYQSFRMSETWHMLEDARSIYDLLLPAEPGQGRYRRVQ